MEPERDWLLAVIAAEPDITLASLSARLLAERGACADTGMLSRFFVAEGVSFKKEGCPPSRIGATSCELEALPRSA